MATAFGNVHVGSPPARLRSMEVEEATCLAGGKVRHPQALWLGDRGGDLCLYRMQPETLQHVKRLNLRLQCLGAGG